MNMAAEDRIDARTELIGLIATPIGHSISPRMHNLALKKLGLNAVYMAFDVGQEQLEATVRGFRALSIRGWNVSMPNKQRIIPYLDELSPAARLSGAVNTVVNEQGRLIGHNTDGVGFVRGLSAAGIPVSGKKMTVLGAGGAAMAIAVQSALDGLTELSIFNRSGGSFDKARRIVHIINEQMPTTGCHASCYRLEDQERLRREVETSDILTNATNVGMAPLEGQSLIAETGWLSPELVVADVIYMPRKTRLMEQAKEAGCQVILNGLNMVLYQGAEAFKLWFGQDMPVDFVKEKLDF